MDTLQAILLGIVQGITEFLPVSSSGHLQIAKELLGVEIEENLTFDVILHAATVLSTIVVLWHEVWRLLKGLFSRRFNEEQAYILKIVVSMIPIGIVGFCSRSRSTPCSTPLDPRLRRRHAAADGRPAGLRLLCQAAAAGDNLLPRRLHHRTGAGVCRHARTLAFGLDHRHRSAARQQEDGRSPVLVPHGLAPILGETLLEAAGGELTASVATGPLVAGFLASFITGCLACRFMIEIVKRGRLIWFAVYCALAGIISILSYIC